MVQTAEAGGYSGSRGHWAGLQHLQKVPEWQKISPSAGKAKEEAQEPDSRAAINPELFALMRQKINRWNHGFDCQDKYGSECNQKIKRPPPVTLSRLCLWLESRKTRGNGREKKNRQLARGKSRGLRWRVGGGLLGLVG